jgi:uncharacterized protein (TIGR03086 family)
MTRWASSTPLAQALDHLGTTVINALRTTDLALATPCPGWEVRDVLNHLVSTTAKFTMFAAGETDSPHSPPGDLLGEDVQDSFWQAAAASALAWDEPNHAPSTCRLPFGEFPAAFAADINLFDALVHGWDIASAVALPFAMPEPLVGIALCVAEQLCTTEAIWAGHYGPPGEVGAGGFPLTPATRLLVLTGRDPSWSKEADTGAL